MILSRYERMIARRYLFPQKGEGFIFLVAGFSVGAVALGVAALIIVMSVMNGFRGELFDKIVGLNGHAVIQGYDGRLSNWQQIAAQAKRTPGVTSAIPMIETPLMATANGRFEGVLVRGMRIEDINANKTITGNVVAGDIHSVTPGSGKVALASRLADTLGAYPGSQITLWNPEGRSTVVGTVPREVSYTVGAVFETGVYDYDKALVLLPMRDAQELLLMGDQVGMIEVQTSNPDKVQDIVAPLRRLTQGRAVIVDWRQMNSALFQALDLERVVMFIIVCIVVLVAAFNIASSLIMLVRSKTRDIAILRTMGASRGAVLPHFHDGRHSHRPHRHRDWPHSRSRGTVLPPRRGGRGALSDRSQSMGPFGPNPFGPAGEDRSRGGHRHHRRHFAADLPGDIVPGAQGGQHRSGPGASL